MINNFKKRLDVVASLDPEFSQFGSDKHRYYQITPLKRGDVANFEKKAEISLPDDYREFVTNVLSGGVGPGYGLYWLGAALMPELEDESVAIAVATDIIFADERDKQWRGQHLGKPSADKVELPDFIPEEVRAMAANIQPVDPITSFVRHFCFPYWMISKRLELLKKPFPFSEKISATEELESLGLPAMEPVQAKKVSRQIWKKYGFDGYEHGTVSLCHYGRGIYALLVVSGQCKGQVWIFHMEDLRLEPFGPAVSGYLHTGISGLPEGSCSFILWYDHWLASVEAKLQII
jgi:hypothetical protein